MDNCVYLPLEQSFDSALFIHCLSSRFFFFYLLMPRPLLFVIVVPVLFLLFYLSLFNSIQYYGIDSIAVTTINRAMGFVIFMWTVIKPEKKTTTATVELIERQKQQATAWYGCKMYAGLFAFII